MLPGLLLAVVAFQDVTVVDPGRRLVAGPALVVVRDGVIADVRWNAERTPPKGARIIEGESQFPAICSAIGRRM